MKTKEVQKKEVGASLEQSTSRKNVLNNNNSIPQSGQNLTVKKFAAGEQFDDPTRYYTYNHQGQLKFDHHTVKDEILITTPIFRTDMGLVAYRHGVYERVVNDDILTIIQNKIKTEATDSRKREILSLIKHENSMIPLSEFNTKARVLNLKNGIYNLTTKKFEDHSKYIYWTIQQPVKYDPNATCPAILEFLHDILDPDGVQFVIEVLAYMSLPYTDPDKIVFLLGNGGNGKSALQNILKCFLGLDNVTNMSLHDLQEDKFSRAHLYGKLANICGDIDNRVLSNTGIIKSLTGGEPIYAQFKGVDGFNFQSFAKLMFSANELPMSTDKTHGFFRRILIIPFEKKLAEEKKVSRTVLDKRLTSPSELSGLLNLVLEAIKKLEQNDYQFAIPEASKRALAQYKYAHDKVQQFITEECTIDQTNAELKVSSHKFYRDYKHWCVENGIMPEKKIKVNDQLREKGFVLEKGGKNVLYIHGLTFHKNSIYSER